jgi:ribonuclease VapC
VIIDSSAILAIFFRESGAEVLLSTILEAGFAGIGSPTAAETGLVLTGRMKHNATQRAIDAYARFGNGRHPAALNFGDCMTYATAALAWLPRR